MWRLSQDELGDKEWASSDAYTWIVGDALFERLGVYENDQGQVLTGTAAVGVVFLSDSSFGTAARKMWFG